MDDFLGKRLKGLNVYLVGLMGVGKSTIGPELARALGYGFCDTDTIVEQVAGQGIPEIFARQGETGFRQLEGQVLEQLCAHVRLVVATGGGIVTRASNWGYLHQGLVVWLDAPVELIYERIRGDEHRPLLQTPDPLATLRSLLEDRRSWYREADVHLSVTADEAPETTVARLLEQIPTVLKAPDA